MGERQKNFWDKSRLLLHFEHLRPDVFGQVFQFRHRVAADRGRRHASKSTSREPTNPRQGWPWVCARIPRLCEMAAAEVTWHSTKRPSSTQSTSFGLAGQRGSPRDRVDVSAMTGWSCEMTLPAKSVPIYEQDRDMQPPTMLVGHRPTYTQTSVAFTRSGVNGRSRMRRPVALANALPIAAAAGPCAPSPTPRGFSSGRSINCTSTAGTSVVRRIG